METKANEKDNTNGEEDYPFHHFLRRMVLAGIGTLSFYQEEWEKFFDKMVERGEATHKDHETMMKDFQQRRDEFLKDRKAYTYKRVEKAFDTFDVPNKKDIDEIKEKISTLEKKIDALKKPAE